MPRSCLRSYTAVKDYPSALASFFQCIATPAHSLSKIVVCAVKKARLIALIQYGSELVVSWYVNMFQCMLLVAH